MGLTPTHTILLSIHRLILPLPQILPSISSGSGTGAFCENNNTGTKKHGEGDAEVNGRCGMSKQRARGGREASMGARIRSLLLGMWN